MKKVLFVILLMLTASFTLQCSWWDLMVGGNKTIVIVGEREIKNETLVLVPGTTVILESKFTPSIAGSSTSPGGLVIGEGATLIAKGTPDNPIIFRLRSDGDGYLVFAENSTPNSKIEYCKFNKGILVKINKPISILRSKFDDVYITLERCDPLIKYNDFSNTYVGRFSPDTILTCPIFKYNNFKNSTIAFGNNYPTIEFNNILDSSGYGIIGGNSTNKLLAKYNYIANCNGMVGVDTNGSQCLNVIFSNYYRTEPVPDAGCGW